MAMDVTLKMSQNLLAHYEILTQSFTISPVCHHMYNQNVPQDHASHVCRFPSSLIRVQKQKWYSPFQPSGKLN